VLAALLLLPLIVVFGCRGHIIRAEYVPNHPDDFDFENPPCAAASRPDTAAGAVLVRYIGVGGLYIEWNGRAILTAPFFSNYGVFHTAFKSVSWDLEAIERGMAAIEDAKIGAVLVAHSHYDHIGDLPPILEDYLPGTEVLLNRSGLNMLENCPGLDNTWVVLEDHEGQWIRPRGPDGVEMPLRLMPIPSKHPPHAKLFHYAKGEVDGPLDCIQGRKLSKLKEGRVYAFLIDLLADDGETVLFRIHYQDVASPEPFGLPPEGELASRPADLAVLSLPLARLADGYPEAVLTRTRARHALIIHYEDFFRPADRPLRFVPLLSNRRANRFMELLREAMGHPVHEPVGPRSLICGPSGDAWTIPLPGEWLLFRGSGS
jgi:hypothetical protein